MWKSLHDFATGEFATKVLAPGAIAFLTTIVTGSITRRKDERQRSKSALTDEIKRIITVINQLSEHVAEDVQNHLLGIPMGTFKESQRKIGSQIKAIGSHLESAKLYLPSEAAAKFENEFLKWDDALTGTGYPIDNKKDAFQPHDPRIKQVQDAQIHWQKCLSQLSVKCIRGQITLKCS